MTYRRSHAPVQTDPIRNRLGKPGVARDLSCPHCGVVFTTERRWQMRCPECDHRWIDRSGRTLIDSLRDARMDAFVTLFMGAGIVMYVGAFVVCVGLLFNEAAGLRGWDRTYGLAALFLASFASLFVLVKLFRH